MKNQSCERAEVLAGAVALGEATDAERNEYRGHIAGCASCVFVLGGERDIERVMQVVAQARDEETWEPAPVSLVRERRWSRWLTYSFSAATAALAISLGLHALVATSFGHAATPGNPIVIDYDGTHITLEHRQPPQRAAKTHVEPHMVVVHNVVTLRAPVASASHPQQTIERPAIKQTTTVDVASDTPISMPTQAPSQVPVWRREAAPRRGSGNSYPVATNYQLEQHAESMAISPGISSTRDVAPIGGDAAINPRPAAIAFAEGAEGTSVFEVAVDDRGNPTKCTITRSSGFLVLDDAVCRAAMKARYTPRSINGRAVAGTYRDAFTFRSGANYEGVDATNPQL